MPTAKLGPNAGNPRLSKTTLTYLLVALAIVPSAATIGLRLITPGVKEGQLPVSYRLLGMAGPDYYALSAETRPPLDDPRLQITNTGTGPLTQLNVILNYSHEIRDPHLVLAPNQSVVYRLKRFYNRAGIPFVPELSPINHLRIFAKQDDLSRASVHVPITMADYGQAEDGQLERDASDTQTNDQDDSAEQPKIQNTDEQNTGEQNNGEQNTGEQNTDEQNTDEQNTDEQDAGEQDAGDQATPQAGSDSAEL